VRKISVFVLATLILATISLAEAQQPKKVPRIGYLAGSDAATEYTRSEGVQLALRELGYIEGQNIATEYRYTEGNPDRNHELAAELVRLEVDIIVVSGGNPPIQAAKNATKTIHDGGGGSDPVKAGLIEALRIPAATSLALHTLAQN
jgi:putative ABC transport system substrate-binding protein